MVDVVSRSRSHIGPVGKLPFLVIVLVPYVHMFLFSEVSLTPSELISLVLVGLVYTAVGIVGPEFLDRLGSQMASAAYFAFQIPIGIWIQYMSHNSGTFWLILLPLAVQSLFWFSRNGMIVVSSIIVMSFLLAIGLRRDWAEAGQSAFLYLSAVLFVGIFAEEMVREQASRSEVARLAEKLSEANRKPRDFGGQAEDLATITERNRLAAAIHDSLDHYLTAIAVHLGVAQAELERDRGLVRDSLRNAQTLAEDGLAAVRRSAAALRALPLETRPLPEAVAALANGCQASGIIAELAVHGAPRSLPPQSERTLYRAAQEGLANVCKHSQASRVDLTLDYSERRKVRLVIRDDGVGAAENVGGFGLLAIRERVQLLRGEFRATTAIGQGFTLEVEVPG